MKAQLRYLLLPCLLYGCYCLLNFIFFGADLYNRIGASNNMLLITLLYFLSLAPIMIIPCWLYCITYRLDRLTVTNGAYVVVLLVILLLMFPLISYLSKYLSAYLMRHKLYFLFTFINFNTLISLPAIVCIAVISHCYAKMYLLKASVLVNNSFIGAGYAGLLFCLAWGELKPLYLLMFDVGFIDILYFIVQMCVLVLIVNYAYYWARAQVSLSVINDNYLIKLVLACLLGYCVFKMYLVLLTFIPSFTWLVSIPILSNIAKNFFLLVSLLIVSYVLAIYLLIRLQYKSSAKAYKIVHCCTCCIYCILILFMTIFIMVQLSALNIFVLLDSGALLGELTLGSWGGYLVSKFALWLIFNRSGDQTALINTKA